MNPNIETFIGCESSYEEAEIVLFGAPFDSTTSFRPRRPVRLRRHAPRELRPGDVQSLSG